MTEKVLVFGGSLGSGYTLNRLLPQIGAGDLMEADAAAIVVNHLIWNYAPVPVKGWYQFPKGPSAEFRDAVDGEQILTGSGLLVPYITYPYVARQNGSHILRLMPDEDEDPDEIGIDLLFRSASTAFGSGTVGVLLSGSGDDGVYGLRRIREAGGKTLVHDYREAGGEMNKTAIQEGLADGVFRIQDFRRCLTQYL